MLEFYQLAAAVYLAAAVTAALGLTMTVDQAYSTHDSLSDGGSVTAVVRDDSDQLLLVVDYQGFTDGDADWREEMMAGDSGEPTLHGELYIPENALRPLSLIVSDAGALTIAVESPTIADSFSHDKLRTFAVGIAEGLSDLVR